jgi:hypothetical protein
MAFGFDGGPDFFDFAGFADEEGAAHDAHELASHELFFLPGAVGLDRFVIGIAEQREIELVLGLEPRQGFDGIRAHAQDGHTLLIELLFCVTKLGRFDGSTGSVGFRKEEEQDAPPLEVFQRDVFAFLGWEPEAGGFVAEFEHEKFPVHSCCAVRPDTFALKYTLRFSAHKSRGEVAVFGDPRRITSE